MSLRRCKHQKGPKGRLRRVSSGVGEHGAHQAKERAPAALSRAVGLVHLWHRIRAPQPHLSGPQVNFRVLELGAIVGVPEVDGARSKGAKEEMAMVTYEGASGVDNVGLLEVA